MMKTIIITLLLLILNLTGYTEDKVYIGMTYSANTVLLEDNSFVNNDSLWNKDKYGSTYDSYLEYINKFLEKNFSVQDSNGFILFSEYRSEFSKLTDIRIGEKFYVSAPTGIFEATVTGYLINPEYSYFSSSIFYVLLDVENVQSFEEWTPVVISGNPEISIMRLNITSPEEVYKTGMEIIKNTTQGRKFTVYNYEDDNEVLEEFRDFNEEDYRLFKGNFTQNSKGEFIANLSSRLSFMYYINAVFIINSNGDLLYKIAEPQEKDFNYFVVKGIVDIDNDGIDEILIDVGYYEGTGLYLYKYDGSEYKIIAEGFVAGV